MYIYLLLGTIPSTIGSVTSITYLNLAGNVINGITNRSVTIHVSNCDILFIGTIPSTIGRLTALSYVYLNSNSFTG